MISLLTVAVVGAAPLASFSPLPQDPVAKEVAPAEHGAEPKWVTDWEAAKAQAKKEGKDLLVDFTGSDWCGWCIKLHEEVFSHAEFSGPAAELFVFVELDFPRQKEQSDELKAQNQRLQTLFGVEGFPTIFLADADGLPYGQTGYQPGGPEKYLGHVKELQEARVARDGLKAKADGAKGVERAKLLAEAVDSLPEELRGHYLGWMDEIIALDADGKAGLKEKFATAKAAIAMKAEIAGIKESINELAMKGEWGPAAEKLETFLTEKAALLSGEPKMEMCYIAGICRQRGGDVAKAIEHFEAAMAVLPEHPMVERLKQMVAELKKGGEESGEEKKKD